MFAKIVVAALVFCAVATDAQVISIGKCAPVTVKQDFDLSQYLGRWYEQQRYFTIFEIGLDCVAANYSLRAEGDVKVNNTGRQSNGQPNTAIGRAYVPDASVPAKLLVKFNENQPAGDYWVIDTDYTAFSVVYSCRNLGPFKSEYLWLLSRDRSGYTPSVEQRVEQILQQQHISPKPLKPVNQLNCQA
ncbi:apolipoprotein D-like [Paramacrobiotus metropolitanus]|uniref:apolipoprotein D-like n=1 Tax=Paramacrobiotus metropolitanus TaxID=2943436 RepID=UPI0024455FDB|nr:apolipoprotein D-like [Paramacrobiotus metropolitanus]